MDKLAYRSWLVATMLYYTLDEAQEGGKAFLEKRKPDFDKYPQFP